MRLFAGIALDDRTRAACAGVSRRLEAMGFGARFGDPEGFHLTLAFLGNVDASRYKSVVAALDAAAAAATPFSLTLDKIGAFPHERRPRVVYVGSRAPGTAFRNLARAVRERYAALGFTFEDDSVAHVTIARATGGAQKHLPPMDIPPAVLEVKELALFESLREGTVARYVIRHTAPLRS